MNYAARSLRLRIPRICVAITATDAADLVDRAEAVLRDNALIELRLDHLKSPMSALGRLRRLAEIRPDAILIATCRRVEGGGRFHGTVEAQLEVLRKATKVIVDTSGKGVSSVVPYMPISETRPRPYAPPPAPAPAPAKVD